MKKTLLIIMVLSTVISLNNPVLALPYLQLDISDGIYVGGGVDTVFSTTNPFTLYALIDSANNEDFNISDTFYVSAAIAPKLNVPTDLGFFIFNGSKINATEDMVYGTPPIEGVKGNETLGPHGIYDTYYKEFEFTLDTFKLKKATAYNIENSPGGLVEDSNGTLYFQDFLVDLTGFNNGYSVHFDLYTKNDDGTLNKFAPWSHDAQSGGFSTPTPTPEPATMFLVGFGLVGLAGISRKKLQK